MKTNQPGVVIIEGHVQGLANARSLGKMGVPVIVIDKNNCVARYSRYCKRFFYCPDYSSEHFIDFLIKLNKAENLQNWLLLPSNDHAVFNISQHKAQLSLFYKVITEDLTVLEKIYNKRNLLQVAENSGIPIPQTFMPYDHHPDLVNLRFPLIIKGNNGLTFYHTFHRKAFIVNSQSELDVVLARHLSQLHPEEYFIQEVIPYESKTVSVTLFAVEGKMHAFWMGVKLREHPIRFGTATCCQSMFNEQVLKQSIDLIEELGFSGVCEIEWLKDTRDGLYKLIEINARTWLWVGLAAKCGVDFPAIIYKYVYKSELPFQVEYDKQLVWINIYTDLVFSVKRLLGGIDTLGNIIKTYGNFTEACWDKKDPLPFFVYGLLMFKFIRSR